VMLVAHRRHGEQMPGENREEFGVGHTPDRGFAVVFEAGIKP
jgi:hypothetical protein